MLGVGIRRNGRLGPKRRPGQNSCRKHAESEQG
jgi:hypothetical protein